jgi:hypothetical protein
MPHSTIELYYKKRAYDSSVRQAKIDASDTISQQNAKPVSRSKEEIKAEQYEFRNKIKRLREAQNK